MLRQRLLANGAVKQQRNSKVRQPETRAQKALTQDQAVLNENLREIE